MKLLFDQNLSFRLCELLADDFPGASHVRFLGLTEADDQTLWEFAKANAFTIVSQDADFAEMAALRGAPPKIVWIRAGNQATLVVAQLLRKHVGNIAAFSEGDAVCLEIYAGADT